MKDKNKEKEQIEKMKALRKEIEEKLEEQLPAEILEEKTRVEVKRIDEGEVLEPDRAKRVIEALLFASSKPLSLSEIRKAMKFLNPKEISQMIEELKQSYEEQNRSFEIVEIANGYEMTTKKEFAPWVMKVELQKKARQVTQSALETLAILAYKQPISRPEIEELRGVDVSGVLSTLMERGFVKIVGKKEVPGRPFLYGTTEKFLEHFGLKNITDLPSIEDIKSMVEDSVNKDELLGTTKMIDIPQEKDLPQESSEPSEGQSVEQDTTTIYEGQNDTEKDPEENR